MSNRNRKKRPHGGKRLIAKPSSSRLVGVPTESSFLLQLGFLLTNYYFEPHSPGIVLLGRSQFTNSHIKQTKAQLFFSQTPSDVNSISTSASLYAIQRMAASVPAPGNIQGTVLIGLGQITRVPGEKWEAFPQTRELAGAGHSSAESVSKEQNIKYHGHCHGYQRKQATIKPERADCRKDLVRRYGKRLPTIHAVQKLVINDGPSEETKGPAIEVAYR
ncbi:hypothetical protein H671_2g7353 [Cricetulus griseus]|nr:hypothetical protein H671_2g7353 [Cricetulus griseus]